MSPQRNEFHEVALEVAQELRALRREAEKWPGIPFGFEKLSARDDANRLFGPQSSPAVRKAGLERIGAAEMVKLARTYQGQHRLRSLIPRKGA